MAKCDVMFSAFYPPQIGINQIGKLFIYAHLPQLFDAAMEDALTEFDNTMPSFEQANQSISLKLNTVISIYLESEHFIFQPIIYKREWNGSLVKFAYNFYVSPDFAPANLSVRVRVFVHGVEIASIPECTIAVTNSPMLPPPSSRASTLPYHKIFVSYAHQDTEIVETYRLCQAARGDEVFVDTYSIRSGENWQEAIEEAIKDADIFQLFWSTHSQASTMVEYEWHHALTVSGEGAKQFIRPVYWRKPLPNPPTSLKHLHFAYVPLQNALDSRLARDGFWDTYSPCFQDTLNEIRAAHRQLYYKLEQMENAQTNILKGVLTFVEEGNANQAEMRAIVTNIASALTVIQQENIEFEAYVRATFPSLQQVIESDLGLQHKFEFSIPIIPFILDYKTEIALGTQTNLTRVLEELGQRWSNFVHKERKD